MSTPLGFLAAFRVVSDTNTPEYKLVNGVQKYRVKRRLVYEAPVADSFVAPTVPLNPGGLTPVGWHQESKWTWVRHWVCEDFGVEREYGVPLSSRYREVWTYSNDWFDIDASSAGAGN